MQFKYNPCKLISFVFEKQFMYFLSQIVYQVKAKFMLLTKGSHCNQLTKDSSNMKYTQVLLFLCLTILGSECHPGTGIGDIIKDKLHRGILTGVDGLYKCSTGRIHICSCKATLDLALSVRLIVLPFIRHNSLESRVMGFLA